jgi:DNA polymerase III subunit epsilon
VVAGLVAMVARLVGRYTAAARRLTAETRLLLANPDHRPDRSGPTELAELATAVGELAERRRVAEHEVAAQIGAAQASLEEERNRLAALMAELAAAVIVCNVEGRILLYNAAARSVLDDEAAVGLGRSIFGIVDRDLLAHAVERIQDGSSPDSHVATTLRGEQLLQVQIAAIRGPDEALTGFVLLLEDLTDQLNLSSRRDDLLRELTEGTRSSLGSIQAAIETVVDYPEMEAEQRQQFVGIVREESQRLGRQVERWVAELAAHLGADWLGTEMSGVDLLAVVARALERDGALAVSVRPATDALWVRVDSHALTRAAVHLAGRLHEETGVDALTLAVTRAGGHAQLEATWTGQPADPDRFQAWLDQPLTGGAAPSVREVVARHGGEVWCGGARGTAPHLRLLLPVTEAGPAPAARTPIDVSSRPEFYDFDLFDRHEESLAWHDRGLGELTYTVFDTETTGLEPTRGDEIISVGAVRVVNGRLLRHETFERLVDPERRVPASSTAVHGITSSMLAGQPTIDTVLPAFARYAADTVLVGHNVGFDMQFLRLKEARTGVRFTQPVLDTLLLDAAIHPDHDDHSLEAIAERLGVDVLGRHTALGDALVTGEVFLGLMTLLQQRGVSTLGEALAAARATLHARLDRSLYDS